MKQGQRAFVRTYLREQWQDFKTAVWIIRKIGLTASVEIGGDDDQGFLHLYAESKAA